jgi:hypothetical protein
MFGPQDQDTRRAGARGLTRSHGGLARSLRRAAAGAVCAAAVAVPLAGAATAQAATSAPQTLTSTWTSLTLMNGWADYGNGTAAPAVTNISGIVHLKGAIVTSGTNAEPFILPAGDRPATDIAVPVDQGGASAGELDIQPSGVVTVAAEAGNWSNAQVFTGLDGASFATSGSSFTPLTLQNGWINDTPPYASAAVRNISGIVHLRGTIETTGGSVAPFILPAGFRPNHTVYAPVNLCGPSHGRLDIYANGEVTVESENGSSFIPACPVSLDGASFAKSASLSTPLTLQNGWTSYGSGTISPAVRKISGIVYLEGAMRTSGTNPLAFTLPGSAPPTMSTCRWTWTTPTRGTCSSIPTGR